MSSPDTPPDRAEHAGSTPPADADAASRDDRRHGQDGAVRLSRMRLWEIQIVRDLLLVGLVILLIWIGHALRAVTVPLLLALLLAYLFEPVVARIARNPRFSRQGAVVLILSTLLSAVVLVGGLVTPLLVHQTAQLVSFAQSRRIEQAATDLMASAPSTPGELFDHVRRFIAGPPAEEESAGDAGGEATSTPEPVEPGGEPGAEPSGEPDAEPSPPPVAEGPDRLAGFDAVLEERNLAPLTARERATLMDAMGAAGDAPTVLATLERLLEDREAAAALAASGVPAAEGLSFNYLGILQSSMRRFTGFLGAVLQLGLVAFLIPFYFYFFSVAWPKVIEFAASLVPDRNRERTFDLVKRMDAVVAGFVRGRIVISLIMGVLFAVGWWICGVPYAIPVGLIIGIFSAVPYLGGVGIPVAIGLLLFEQLTQEGGRTMAWWLILGGPIGVFMIVQLVEGYVLTPMIAGKATNLDPVTILVAVLAGGSVLGVYGMLLAIPAAACGKILLLEIVFPRIDAWRRGERTDPLPMDH